MYEYTFTNFGTTLDVCTEAYEKMSEAMQELAQMYNEAAERFKEAWQSIQEIVLEFYEEPMTPREYGMSLLNRKKYTNDRLSYKYIPSVKKNLPYQRRCFIV